MARQYKKRKPQGARTDFKPGHTGKKGAKESKKVFGPMRKRLAKARKKSGEKHTKAIDRLSQKKDKAWFKKKKIKTTGL